MATDTTIPDASAVAEEAFVLAYPLVVMRRTMAQATAVVAPDPGTMRAPVNAIVHGRDTPDTLRVSGWLDLAEEPIVLTVPATHGRYYALWLRDGWTTVFASVGARTTGTAARAFAILGPRWHGRRVPAELTAIAAPTRIVHVAGCVEAVHESGAWVHEGFGLTPLSAWRRESAPAGALAGPVPDPVAPAEQVERMDARAFFSEVSQLTGDNPPDAACRAVLERLRELGGWDAPAAELRERIARGLGAGRAAIQAGTQRPASEGAASWQVRSDLGHDHDALLRARAARSGRPADPVADVFNAQVDRDADGQPLTGRGRYVLRFEPDAPPPVHGFWSLEALPERAHSIGDRRGPAIDPDGSLPVYIQRRPTARKRRSNWLPAPAEGFSIALHLYWPHDEALHGHWTPPPVTRVG